MGNTLISAILVMLVVTVLLAILLVWIKNALMPSGSVKVSINNGSKELEVAPGGDLMHTLADHGIFLPSACGGKANCGQCKLQVLDGGGTILPTETGFFQGRLAPGLPGQGQGQPPDRRSGERPQRQEARVRSHLQRERRHLHQGIHRPSPGRRAHRLQVR